jgi:hypothetical protein
MRCQQHFSITLVSMVLFAMPREKLAVVLRSWVAGWNAVFNRRALFVVVPCLDHYEWQKIAGLKILAPHVCSVAKGLAATRRYVPVQSPGCPAVIETGPLRPHYDLVGIL